MIYFSNTSLVKPEHFHTEFFEVIMASRSFSSTIPSDQARI
jgi:hypothetical protein